MNPNGAVSITPILLRFFRYTIRRVRPVEKGLVCNRKGPICKNLTVEINLYDWFF
jgi:hypothetical protein